MSSCHFQSVNVWRINWCESTQWERSEKISILMFKSEFLSSDSIYFLSYVLKIHPWATRWLLFTLRMNWYLVVSLSSLLSPLPTCWPLVHLLGASCKVNGSSFTSWHWRCHFILSLGHKTSRASWMLPMRLWPLKQLCMGTAGKSLTLCSV